MVKNFKPRTPSTRFLVLESREALTEKRSSSSSSKTRAPKSLLFTKKKTGGRNNLGRITCRHRGGGHKQKVRRVDFKRRKMGIEAKVVAIEYDPNRSAFLALLSYQDGEKAFIIAPEGLREGDVVSSGTQAPYKTGCAMALKDMPIGSVIHNIEMQAGRGAQMVRSAGLSAQLMGRNNGYATLRLPSGEMRNVREECFATFGVVSNSEHNLRVEGKAGRKRWQGIRPTTRGTAMNPVDHPHGGGEGRHNGYIPQTPWAKPTKGYKTRCKRKSSKFILKDRRKK